MIRLTVFPNFSEEKLLPCYVYGEKEFIPVMNRVTGQELHIFVESRWHKHIDHDKSYIFIHGSLDDFDHTYISINFADNRIMVDSDVEEFSHMTLYVDYPLESINETIH
jgi:hypothetical protein